MTIGDLVGLGPQDTSQDKVALVLPVSCNAYAARQSPPNRLLTASRMRRRCQGRYPDALNSVSALLKPFPRIPTWTTL
jgi:hypothetical protein